VEAKFVKIGKMVSLHTGAVLTPEERLARRRLMLRDAVSLFTLFMITAVIFALTWLLFQSFEDHRQDLGRRWKSRGEQALHRGDPRDAIEALRSALAYVPSRDTEIDLATALADAGKTQEAIAYFNTLWDSSPGDGLINLQLARLAARQGDRKLAVQHYQEALDGTWQGNGYNLRREVRLELARYMIANGDNANARTHLLIASSNAPEDPQIKLQIAGLLEKASDPQDALGIYRTISAVRNPPLAALEGAGRTAFALNHYRLAADYLQRAVSASSGAPLSPAQLAADRDSLATAQRLLLLYPGFDLPGIQRAQRMLADRSIARKRLDDCAASQPQVPTQLAPIIARWSQLPQRLTARRLEQQPDLEQTMLQLIYDTETTTAQICGAPTGDDALLLRIARNPRAVEQE
jgi:tetratricopeptide (TPR) repeat protein